MTLQFKYDISDFIVCGRATCVLGGEMWAAQLQEIEITCRRSSRRPFQNWSAVSRLPLPLDKICKSLSEKMCNFRALTNTRQPVLATLTPVPTRALIDVEATQRSILVQIWGIEVPICDHEDDNKDNDNKDDRVPHVGHSAFSRAA